MGIINNPPMCKNYANNWNKCENFGFSISNYNTSQKGEFKMPKILLAWLFDR